MIDLVPRQPMLNSTLLDFALHLDQHVTEIAQAYGIQAYWILFAIIFAETGLVIMPFLPGDSLLFAVGAIAATGALDLFAVMGIMIIAAILGDGVNYWIGRNFGRAMLDRGGRWIKPEHIRKTEEFYERYGGKTIVIARYVPIIRTFAPFVAGVSRMEYHKFMRYNVGGAVLWVTSVTGAGYIFGNLPKVKDNFGTVVLAIILVSLLPALIEFIRARRAARLS